MPMCVPYQIDSTASSDAFDSFGKRTNFLKFPPAERGPILSETHIHEISLAHSPSAALGGLAACTYLISLCPFSTSSILPHPTIPTLIRRKDTQYFGNTHP